MCGSQLPAVVALLEELVSCSSCLCCFKEEGIVGVEGAGAEVDEWKRRCSSLKRDEEISVSAGSPDEMATERIVE